MGRNNNNNNNNNNKSLLLLLLPVPPLVLLLGPLVPLIKKPAVPAPLSDHTEYLGRVIPYNETN
jgi:hypothetical protein